MAEVRDGYDLYYADRLWQLLPAVYRARDRDDPGVSGPLQELVWRIGAQMAVVRRSIDRLWADQSIETCDDWVIPYIGDLLGTNLVNGLDPRGQRVDVAKTIHYRRRKGTLAVLEEIARDVTGWQAHVVEAFRRLSRTRHGLDPPVGPGAVGDALPIPCPGPATAADPTELLRHEGLVGALTDTMSGGFADLRSAHGARLGGSPFDEFSHVADFRSGEGAVGRYGIPKLLVFLWRLQSFAVEGGTPVAVGGCPGGFVFDPTGRRIPMFLAPLAPEQDDWADTWTSAPEWQVPGPFTSSLAQAIADPGSGPPQHAPYPDAENIPAFFSARAGAPPEPVEIETCWPESGQFKLQDDTAAAPAVSYQYGFSAMIGAGPYDRTLLGDPPSTVEPEQPAVAGGGGLDQALAASGATGTVTLADSLTYESVGDVGTTAAPLGSLLIRAAPVQRPVVRLPAAADDDPPAAWTFTGGGSGSELTFDGLLISGGDIVLRGAFSSVRLTGCTTDPGTLSDTGAALATSVDGRPLAPVRIWIEGDPNAGAGSRGAIEQLILDHCVLGPIRTRNGGAVENVTITDSLVQGIAARAADSSSLTSSDVYDPELLTKGLVGDDPLSEHVRTSLPNEAQTVLSSYQGGPLTTAELTAIVDGLNAVIAGPDSIYSVQAFAGVTLPPVLQALLNEGSKDDVASVNRLLLEAGYPIALSAAALAFTQGSVAMTRCSVIGRTFVHRLLLSDSILGDFAIASDPQDGCVRFSATSTGSRVPRQYRSVALGTGAALFTSDSYGDPGYGQLLETADRAIVAGVPDITISAGAQSGSEMGAFSSQLATIKERGLLTKYAEFMPLGLTPVVVHVT